MRAIMPPKLAALAAWLICIAFIGGVAGSHIVPRLIDLHDLAISNRVTQGSIIETYPQMHSTCRYRYVVEGQSYEQTGESCGNNIIGRKITVYFSAADPSKSLNENPESAFLNDLIVFVAALVTMPLFAATVTYFRARRGEATGP
jgi:hypothetical protein